MEAQVTQFAAEEHSKFDELMNKYRKEQQVNEEVKAQVKALIEQEHQKISQNDEITKLKQQLSDKQSQIQDLINESKQLKKEQNQTE